MFRGYFVLQLMILAALVILAGCQASGGGAAGGGGILAPPNPAYTTTISGTTNHVADNVDASTITITVFEGATPVVGIIPTYTVSGSNNFIPACSATDATGTSTCSLRSTRAEVKSIKVVMPNASTSSSVTFIAGPVSTASTITSAGPSVADGATPMTINVSMKDAFGNAVAGITPSFDATNTGTTNSYGSCTASSASGASVCSMTSTKAEVKTLRITAPVTVTGGPAFFFAGPPVAANTTIGGTSPHNADGVDASIVTITMRDAFMNPALAVVPTFSASGTGNILSACSSSDFTGVSTCTLKSTDAGVKNLALVTPIAKAGNAVTFNGVVGSAVAANSTITGTTPVVADGVATSTITITLRDSANAGVPGIVPTFGATNTGSSNSYGVCSATNASGVSTCTLSSTYAETKTLAITTPVVKVGGTTTFVPGPASAVASTITGTSPVAADGVATSTISINIKDAFGNGIAGETPTFSATDSGFQNVYGTCSVTDGAGLSTCTLKSTIAETKTLQLLSPVTVTGGNVVFAAGAAVAANSTITGTGPKIADGVDTSTVTITLRDANNNPVAGQNPTFTATNTGTDNTYGLCSTSNASGVSTCTLRSLTAETKTLSIATPVVKADGTVVFTPAGASVANSTITGTGPVIANGVATSTITINLKDSNNNPIVGTTPTFSATNTGTTNVYSACSATDASGVSTCTLTSTKAETKTLAITAPINKTDGNVVFIAGPAVAATSTITGSSPVVADGTANSNVTITLLDAFSNPVGGETPTFSATDTGSTNTYGTCSASNASGISTCTLSSLKAETKTLSIATPVVKADGTVTFTAGTPVAANSSISGTTPVVADGTATSTVSIVLQDVNNNPVSGVIPTFSATDTGTTNDYGICSATDATGTSTCTLASLTAETKTLSIATPVVKAGSNVVFTSAGASVANSTITGTGPVVADGTATSTVTITLKDSNNNPVPGETPTFSATNTGTTNTYGSCSVTNASGVSTCTLSSLKAEVKTLSIATPIVKADGNVTFTAGSPVAANSNITGSSPVVANGSATSSITVTLRDANSNPVSGQTPTFSATDTGSTNVYGACSASDATGASTCTLSSLKAEVKTLSIATPVVKADGTVTFTAGTPVAANSSITGTTPVVADGSATSTVSIILQDANSNPVSGVTPTFSATDTGSTNTYGSCSASDATGTSTCTLASLTAETKTLSIATPVVKAGSNVVFTSAGASVANSTITGTGPVVADGSATSTVTITLKDANNNPVPGETPTFSATNTGTTNTYGSCSVTNASGVSTCTLSSLKAEIKTLSIATPVVKAGGNVTFTAGSPVAANSTITGSSPVIANGSATSSVTVTLRDANNNPVSGSTPTFSATDTGTTNVYGACSSTDATGAATCTLSSLKAELKTLSIQTPVVKADGNVTFVAGPAVPANSSITGSGPVVADGTSTSTVTITLNDANNNPVSGEVPTFSATNTGNSNSYGICSATDATGVSTCTLSSGNAETKTLSIATPVIKAGGTVVFTPGSAVAANSTITGTGPVTADGSSTSTIVITLRDGSNNPVSGIVPTFSATDTGTTNAMTACSATNASGISTCTLTSTKAETKTLAIVTPVAKTDGTVVFRAGAALAANSTITGTGPVVADGTATSTVTITLNDAFNNPVSAETPTFSASDMGSTNTYGACSATNASGVSTCTLASLKAQTKTLSITSPVFKSDGTVVFTGGAPVAANSTITGTGPVSADGTSTSTVTITLLDINNNAVSGQTPTFSATNTGSTNVYGSCSVSNASGISTCTLASTSAETKTLSIATPFVKAGGTVVFTAGAAVAANSTITGTGPVIANNSATSTITITLRDASNNPVSGIVPTFGATDTGSGNTYGTCSSTNASGISTCTLRSTKAETKTLSIATPVVKADGTVVFTAGAAVAANSTITGTSPVVADGTDSSTITVNLRDAFNNGVSGVTPVFASTGTSNTLVACGATNATGNATCGLRSTRAQVKTLSLTSPFAKTGGNVTFIAGSPSATTTTISGTTPVSADGVSTSFISINILDANSNPISGVIPIFNATDTNSTNVYGACQASDASGLSMCTLASTRAEFKTLQLTSPVAVTGSIVEFSSSLPVAANSTIAGTSPHAADGSTDSTITITLRDGNNNPVAGIQPTFAATDTGTGNSYDDCSMSNASGVSTCTMQSTVAEIKTLQIVSPVTKSGGTVTFTAGAAVAANSTITGTGPVVADNVATSTVTITLKDAFNNPVAGQIPTFTTSGTANSQTSCSSSTSLGVSTCTVKSTKAEVKTLAIATPVVKTGGTVTFTAGAAVAVNSTITGTGPTNPDGASLSTITITLKDANNNNVSGVTPTFTATGSNNTYNSCSATNASGVSTCTMTSTTAETKTLSIATPFVKAGGSVVFASGSPSVANSSISATGPVVANGVATSTITITLKDNTNSAVIGTVPTFTADGSNNTYNACSATNSSGVSTCTMTSTKAEDKTVSLATPILKAGNTIAFVPGPAAAAQSSIACDTTVYKANGTDTCNITVTIMDQFSNAIEGVTPTISVSGTNNTVSACSATDFAGQSTCTLTSTKAEGKFLSIVTPVAKTDTVEYEFNPNGINLIVPIEMADRGLLSTTAAITFARTRTKIDPAEYVGDTTEFFFEINAVNSNTSTPYSVQLLNSAGTAISDATISVPANTTASRRFRVQFTPSGFADDYRVRIPATATAGQLRVNSVRILVKQTNAVKTKIWIPLIGSDYNQDTGNDTSGTAATSTSATYSVTSASYYNVFTRNDTNYDAIPAVGGWTLDVTMRNSQTTGTGYAALFNKTTGQMVAEVSHAGNTAVTQRDIVFNSNASNFVNGNNYELRIRSVTSGTTNTLGIVKAGLWVKLKYLKRTDVHWRLVNRKSSTATAALPDGKFIYEASAYSNPTATFLSSGSNSTTGGGTIQLINTSTSDTSTTGTTTYTWTPTTTFGFNTTAVTLTDNSRYIINNTRTGGTAVVGGAYIIINAREL